MLIYFIAKSHYQYCDSKVQLIMRHILSFMLSVKVRAYIEKSQVSESGTSRSYRIYYALYHKASFNRTSAFIKKKNYLLYNIERFNHP